MRKREDKVDVFENVKVPSFPQSGSPEDISKYIEMREMGTVTKSSLQPERDVVDEWMRKREDKVDVFENVKVPSFPQSGSPEDISKYIEMREMGTVTRSSLVQWLFNMLKDPAIFTMVFRQILDLAAQVINIY
jgi:hypothetical protein